MRIIYFFTAVNSRPIGSERVSKPSNSPWDITTLYDSLGSSDNLGGYLTGSGTLGTSGTMPQTFDPPFNGLPTQPQQDYLSPLTMSPNVTPSKNDYGDYLTGTGNTASGAMMPPGSGNTPGKKMQGFLDPPPMGPGPLGMAGRGDPASVRRNMVSPFKNNYTGCLIVKWLFIDGENR